MTSDQDYCNWKRDATFALAAGIGATALMGLAAFLIGRVSGGEARVLVEAILPTSRFLCSAVMTATATILALMLTLLGMSVNAETDVNPVFYRRIKQIAFYDMIVLVAATSYLVVHCIPITKTDDVPTYWYSVIYYFVLVVSAGLGGAIVAIVSMLYAAVRDVIHALALDDDHELQRTDPPAGE